MLSRLDRRATLEQQTLVPDGAGGYLATWNVIASVWAGIEPVAGSDAFGPDASESRVRYRITIRRRNDVFAGMRLRSANRPLTIRTWVSQK